MTQYKISDIYYTSILNPGILDIILFKLSKFNNTFTKWLSYTIDYYRYKKKTDKLVASHNIDLEVYGQNLNHAIAVHKTLPFEIWELETVNGTFLQSADNHLVYTLSYDGMEEWKFIKDLTVYDRVLTYKGWDHVLHIKNTLNTEFMYDLSIQEVTHDYLANGIISHNTTTIGAMFAFKLCFTSDLTTLVVANKKETSVEILGKIKEFLEGLPFFLKPGIVSMSATKIKFENGSSIKAGATSKTPATGDSIKLLYIDEAAVIPPNIIDEFWASVQPTMSSFRGAQVIMSSTPRGKGNLFYRTYDGALKGLNGFISSRVDWWEVPGRDAEWERQQRIDLGDELFNREFGLSFESSNTRLLSAYYINYTNRIKKEFISHDLYNVPKDISSKIFWHPDFDPGSLTYYDCLQRYFLFVVDTAEGLEKGAAGKKDSDYNVINIFELKTLSPNRIEKNRLYSNAIDIKDIMSFRQVGIYIDNQKDEEESAEAAKCLAFQVFKTGYREIDNVRVLIEMNFNGKNWINKFKAHPGYYESLIIKCPRGIEASGHPKLLDGFKTTGGAHGKNYYCELGAKMMDKLQIIIQQHNEAHPVLSSLYQLQNFGKNKKGSYEGSCVHDDIAVTCLFVCIAMEQESFQQWCDEWLSHQYPTDNIQKIRYMLDNYVETEPTVTDEEFSKFFNAASAHLHTGITTLQNTYSQIGNNIQRNQGYNGFGGRNMGSMNPYRRPMGGNGFRR